MNAKERKAVQAEYTAAVEAFNALTPITEDVEAEAEAIADEADFQALIVDGTGAASSSSAGPAAAAILAQPACAAKTAFLLQ